MAVYKKVILNIIISDTYRTVEPFGYFYNRLSLFVVMQRIMTVIYNAASKATPAEPPPGGQ
ncbi:hypothetical protein SAMN02746065_11684 [Desulfocicer vacuolatum DSM 3385]|uniref:Uncharacterized protein n=1 Tax=Desulfocicer vacuolatum DSM 3385 TaxID=1121400 RepID=A0A1W2DB33_9BACT|nr:hypothetical protein SAMN02746065_11684 [Desulfocicer vacuolatum DSM 3385]